MQISFLKDLATPRLPTSRFTFLNYLHDQKRLDHFINLGTFLPARREYEDYLRWCARWFEGRGEVEYGVQVEGVVGVVDGEREGEKVGGWDVVGSRAGAGDGEIERCTWRAKHVVIAAGGQPAIPPVLQGVENVYHSSVYAYQISQIEEAEKERKSEGRKLRLAVIGSGQSAAEIFNDLWDRFGDDAEVKLVVKGTNLRPSDDSPLYVLTHYYFHSPFSLFPSSFDLLKSSQANHFNQRKRNIQPLKSISNLRPPTLTTRRRHLTRPQHQLRRRPTRTPRTTLRKDV